mgnify:FL=1
MKNAQNIAIEFHNALPYYDRPEYTENREGFYTCAAWKAM